MCVFSKSLVDPSQISVPPTRKSSPWWRIKPKPPKSSRVSGEAKAARLQLLLSYGIIPRKFNLGRAFKYSGATIGIGAASAGIPVAGTAAGFASSGIAAGSVAAAWQSAIGSVAAGSTFASLQGLGATGAFIIGGPISLALGGVGLVAAAGTFIGVGISKHLDEIKNFAVQTKLILPHM